MFTFNLELDYEERIPRIVKKRQIKKYDQKQEFATPQSIADMINDVYHLDRQAEEHLILVCLNTKGHIIAMSEISHGSINQSICQPREIMIRALIVGAASIILVHNHPSGDSSISSSDREVARRIKHACDIMAIQLLDFIIIGYNEYYSMQENREFEK